MRALRLACGAALLWLVGCGGDATRPPNIVVILADDLGYGDIAPYGSGTNRTPHLERLAREGLLFTDFHSNGAMCTPTRAALLTGRYQHRLGAAFEVPLSARDQHDEGLPLEQVTVAEVLREAGYATGMFGKWHLGFQPPLLPKSQGFDEFWGLTSGDGDHRSHLNRSGDRDWWHGDELVSEEGYTAELLTEHAVAFIEAHRERPFFVYLAHLAIHFPWQAPDDAAYRVEGQSYWEQGKLGDLASKDVSAKTKAMIEAVDASVGRVVAALEENGLADDTLLVFTSDNGGYLTYSGGYHSISSNGPLRGQKSDLYEGGHRVPAIAWWPGAIDPGETDATSMTMDLLPTFADLAGVAAPAGTDGTSLTGVLRGGLAVEERTLFWRDGNEKAVRRGRWKLVMTSDGVAELYDLDADVGEQADMATSEPEVVAELGAALQAWEADVDDR